MYRFLTCTALCLALGAIPIQAQFIDQGFGGGFTIGGSQAITEQNNGAIEYVARAYLRQGLVRHLAGELHFGSGRVEGSGFETRIHPVELRALFSPFDLGSSNVFLFAGIGVHHYQYYQLAFEQQRHKGESGWMAGVPVGLGLQFLISDNVAFEINGGFTQLLGDRLNVLEGGANDGYWNLNFGFTGVEAGDADSDKDGLSNREERELGTDPRNPDTDGDGLRDGAEVRTHGTNPLLADTDGDTLSDGREVNEIRSDPLKVDTDGDGLGDGAEVDSHRTNPLLADTDSDGLGDGEEVTTTKTDPLQADTDKDGLRDGDEVKRHKTNPVKPDTDGDMLSDGDEVNRHNSNPLVIDTDGDGLADNEEVNKYRSNPANRDTDGGTVDDGTEVKRGTDPLDRSDDVQLQAEVGKALVLDGIVFNTGSSDILPQSEEVLQKAYNTLRFNPEIVVEIHGHTDSRGARPKNMKLSDARATSVRDWLIAKGIAADRLKAKGFGPDRPVAPNTTEEGRQQNRRIEFVRTK